MRHFDNNMADVVGPDQSVIYNYTKKFETGHLLNLRTSEVDARGGGSTLAPDHRSLFSEKQLTADFRLIVP